MIFNQGTKIINIHMLLLMLSYLKCDIMHLSMLIPSHGQFKERRKDVYQNLRNVPDTFHGIQYSIGRKNRGKKMHLSVFLGSYK